MSIEICKDAIRWDEYVSSNPTASNYHRWGWREVILETFGHNPYYLAAVKNQSIEGVLPLFHIKSLLFGNFLVSMPFFTYGGVLANSPKNSEALLGEAELLARRVGASHLELRQGSEIATTMADSSPKVTMEVELPDTNEELFNRLSPKMRKRIRYARKNGLEPSWHGPEAISDFYTIFAINMRNLGTPVYPLSFFRNICRLFPDQIRILTLAENGRPVASAFISIFRDTVELPWAATLPESRDKFSPLLLYWTLLEWAQQNGYRCVDLGRCTPGSGNYDFKRRWVCTEKPLHWYYWLADGIPIPQLRPDNPRYKLATRLWKRLPLKLANFFGPRIVRSIP